MLEQGLNVIQDEVVGFDIRFLGYNQIGAVAAQTFNYW